MCGRWCATELAFASAEQKSGHTVRKHDYDYSAGVTLHATAASMRAA